MLMTSLQLEIVTHEKRLIFDLIGKNKVKIGESVDISTGVSVTYRGTRMYKARGTPDIIELILTIGARVPVSVVGTWLWTKLQGRATSLRIDGTQIELQEGKITRYLREKIERK